MALILAVDPGGARSAALGEVRRALGGHDLMIVEDARAAMASADRRMPDVVLLPAELDASDADAVCTHLRDRAGHDVPMLTLPALDVIDGRADPRAIAVQVERALRAPVLAAARALIGWVRARQAVIAGAPAGSPVPVGAGGSHASFPMDDSSDDEAEETREPWLGPAIASIGRGAASGAGAAARGVGSVAMPLLRWLPRVAVVAVAGGLVAYGAVKGRPYVMQRIEEFRNRPAAATPAAEPAPPAADTPAPEPAESAARAEAGGANIPGWVAVFAPFELAISEGGRVLRVDERNEIRLSPGAHQLTFRNERFGFEQTQQVTIDPAKTTRITVIPPRSSISISANRPADVWLDGEPVGQTPLLDLPADLGTREVVLRTEDGVERRRVIEITVDPVALDVDFSQP